MRTSASRSRRLFAKYGVRWALGVVFTILAIAQAIELLPAALADRIDLFIYDLRLVMQPVKFDPRVVIVNIDEKSLAEVGRWPWSRNIVADLVDQLADRYHVRTIGFDVMFTEADTSSGYATMEALANGELKAVPQFRERLQTLKSTLDYDGRLAQALQNRPVVLAYNLSNQVEKGILPAPAFTSVELNGYDLEVRSWKGYEGNLPALQRAARNGGYMNTQFDLDGKLRSTPLLAQVGNRYYESLGLATARVALGATAVRPIFIQASVMQSEQSVREFGALDAIALDAVPRQVRILVENDVKVLIAYRGRGGPQGGGFRYVSAVDVLKGRVPQDVLDQRIVLVGTTAPGLKDLRVAPVNIEFPGVEAHANIISSILDRDFKQRPEYSRGFNLIQVALLGIVLLIVLPVLSPGASILVALGTVSAVTAFNFWMYQSAGLVLPVANALLLVMGLSVINLTWGYLFEYRKGRALVSRFGEYVAPELVAEMADDPDSYQMEGESRELTVLFADVRGFTTISEGLEPNTLREYINIYLTAMSAGIRDSHHGTLDKYIGDAVMAFWGAPVHFPDHAARSVATALLMQAAAHQLSADFTARGWPALRIGIGINTGQMRVGDMGSQIRRAYTVMGDAVNLASRLEGITKIYGAGIVVGEATRLAAPQFAYRELDRVRVKGKTAPVPIFEPLAHADQLDEPMRQAIAQWQHALELIRAQQWVEAEPILQELHHHHPHDGLYILYLQRIAYYRTHPPELGWDGVTTFDTK